MFCPFYLILGAISIQAASLKNLKNLIGIENELLQNFRGYAKELEEKINNIDAALVDYKKDMVEATSDPELFLSNPLNAFRLMRHMHHDWTNWQIYLKEQVGTEQVRNIQRLLSKAPAGKAFNKAVKTLQNITKYYDYEPSFLVNQKEFHSELYLSPLDCYHIGIELYQQHKYFEAAKWLTAAADNYTSSEYSDLYSTIGVPRWKVYQMQSKVFQNLYWHEKALEALNSAINLDPYNVDLLQQQRELELHGLYDPQKPLPVPKAKVSPFQRQCRENFPLSSDLSCQYTTMVSPFLELAPLKLEEVIEEPYTMLYHDIISSHEILHIKAAFNKCPSNAKFKMNNGLLKGCSISDRFSMVTKRINELTKDMTGLTKDMKNLHVLRYDQLYNAVRLFELFKTSPKFAKLDFEDIEATVIIFLNDVKVGGALTIPNEDITIYPRSRDALVIFNEGYFEHIICPNLRFGSPTTMLPLKSFLIILIIFKTSLSHSEINYMTLPIHKQKLLEIDLELIGNLERYANKLQEKIDTLQRLADEIRQPLIEAEGRQEEYLGNPLNSFPLVRHLYSDWDLVEEFMANRVGQEQIDFLKEKLSELPLPKDLSAATEAIYRIELAYGVKPSDLAKGLIDGVHYDSKLSSLDCYVMATHHFGLGDYSKASQWLTVALALMNSSDMKINSVFKYKRSDVSLMLARCFLEMSSETEARYVLSKEVNMTTKEIDIKIKQLQLVGDNSYLQQKYGPDHLLPEGFNAICQSSHKPKPTRLHCRYNTTTTPFLRLAPFRMEELSLDPYIVAYHNVLSDETLAQVDRLSAPLLKKTVRLLPDDIDYDVRTVDSAWFPNDETPPTKENDALIKRIINFVSDLTGLNADLSSSFQAVRYGFGGHYSPHHDYFNESIHQTQVNGDRLATVLFYLNTVKHGGATVFPSLNLKVPAEKGKVLFWYNLDGESFDFDENTEHGVCPVVDGIKLILASWINEWDQMFIKPNYRQRKQIY
ncbi:uncharacterized protein [Drosophila tropicalis]|uniref:uncharacterized protein n=1 Tax=Drosophila tropicalis TaxID=46794 RepID=UPI0035AB6BD9